MKLLKELAFKTKLPLEQSIEQIENAKQFFLNDGKFIKFIEGNELKLFESENYLALFTKNDEFIGWIYFVSFNEKLEIKKIFIIKEFRNKKYAKILLFWVKEYFKKNILIGDAIFSDGENFIKSLEKDNRFDLYCYDKKSNEKTEFDLNMFFKKDNFLLIEHWNDFTGYYENVTPGNETEFLCLKLFGDEEEFS